MSTLGAAPVALTTFESIYQRHAVRSYRPDIVDEATIRRLLDAAVHAPTAMHEEPWEFVIVQDRAVLRSLSDRAKQLMLTDATAHRDLLRAPGATPDGRLLAMLRDPSFNIFYDASTLIVIAAKPLGQFVAADCWLAAENLMLAACALGLGTCCVGFALPVLHTAEVKSELGIPGHIEPVAAIIVGVPNGHTPVVPRKAPDILRWIHAAK